MAARALLEADVDGAHLQFHRLACAECPLDFRQILVSRMDDVLVGHALLEIGFQDVAALQLARLRERLLVDSQLTCRFDPLIDVKN